MSFVAYFMKSNLVMYFVSELCWAYEVFNIYGKFSPFTFWAFMSLPSELNASNPSSNSY